MKTRKGFTLVELLIVIVVIGILSAMMMLSSNEAVTSAKASNVVSNLRNLKTAALAYYADNIDTYFGKPVNEVQDMSNAEKKGIFQYLNNGVDIPDSGDYKFTRKNNNGEDLWFVMYDMTSNNKQLASKLAGRAKSVGLLYGNASQKNGDLNKAYTNESWCAMRIR